MRQPTPPIHIRRAERRDEAAVGELLDVLDRSQRAWREFELRASYRSDMLARYRAIREDRNAIHVVAEQDDRVVGMGVGIIHRPSSMSDEIALEVSSFVVRETARHQGIGRAILAEIVGFAREHGVRHLDLRVFAANDHATEFWRRLGFRPRIVQMVAQTDDVLPTP